MQMFMGLISAVRYHWPTTSKASLGVVPRSRIGCQQSLSKGQKGIVTLNGGPSPIRVYVWNALEIVRDPYSSAGTGKITLTATALVSEVYIPHGTSQVKEINPKLVA